VVELSLALVGLLFVLALAAAVAGGRGGAPQLAYGAAFALSMVVAGAGLVALVGSGGTSFAVLPIGLPWMGAHFRLDALAAFFVVVVGLGGGAASFYGIGHATHDAEPRRVVPFFVAFLGAMMLVVLADDAFTFLVSWELMSLLSWALVLAHHHEADSRKAAFVYLMMAA